MNLGQIPIPFCFRIVEVEGLSDFVSEEGNDGGKTKGNAHLNGMQYIIQVCSPSGLAAPMNRRKRLRYDDKNAKDP